MMHTFKERKKSPTNKTGIPTRLKKGIEQLSGYTMDDVSVHYNSSKPSKMQALAYTQENHVYLAPGQEKHLGHELWHVVQQKRSRVMPTTQINGLPVNDDATLEREADLYGNAAAQMGSVHDGETMSVTHEQTSGVMQRFTKKGKQYNTLRDYYNSTSIGKKRRDIIEHLLDKTGESTVLDIDISNCENWNAILKEIVRKFKEDPSCTKSLFNRYADNMYSNMDFSQEHTKTDVFGGYNIPIETYVENLDIFNSLYHHEHMDRTKNPPNPEQPIDPADIQPRYDSSKSCVITALFKAEESEGRHPFGATDVENLHKILTTAFDHNQYTDDPDATSHQKNCVWKNYSDDSVYPSLYAYFGYHPHGDSAYLNKHIKTAIDGGSLPNKKGMISVEGHMLYFDNTQNPPSFFDNDHGENALTANRNKSIQCIYYKG